MVFEPQLRIHVLCKLTVVLKIPNYFHFGYFAQLILVFHNYAFISYSTLSVLIEPAVVSNEEMK